MRKAKCPEKCSTLVFEFKMAQRKVSNKGLTTVIWSYESDQKHTIPKCFGIEIVQKRVLPHDRSFMMNARPCDLFSY